MGFICGIVGLPNVGKSTLFNALTRAGAAVAPYPFCTIEPNVGMVAVPDARLERLASLLGPEKVTPTTLQFVDIAGLVEGAHKGLGRGNQFLDDVRNVDAIAHVVRLFADVNVSHDYGTLDSVRDAEIVATELLLRDLDLVEKRWTRTAELVQKGRKENQTLLTFLTKARDALQRGVPIRHLSFGPEEMLWVREMGLLTAKPVLYVANIDEAAIATGQIPPAFRSYANRQGAGVVALCARVEAELVEFEDQAERAQFAADLGLAQSGLQQVVRAGYDLLGLITFYTTVGVEVRAWTVSRGTAAAKSAGKIHSDMEQGFIRAEVLRFEDIDRLGSEAKVREAGLARTEGRDYEVVDGDVIRFRFRV